MGFYCRRCCCCDSSFPLVFTASVRERRSEEEPRSLGCINKESRSPSEQSGKDFTLLLFVSGDFPSPPAPDTIQLSVCFLAASAAGQKKSALHVRGDFLSWSPCEKEISTNLRGGGRYDQLSFSLPPAERESSSDIAAGLWLTDCTASWNHSQSCSIYLLEDPSNPSIDGRDLYPKENRININYAELCGDIWRLPCLHG